MASKDSLFSFEVAVECLHINVATIACRFPAIAFRLLDFPSLLIPHLDEDERRHFKAAVLFDYHGEIPLKFKDLLDSRGNFQFNKGKSCMFKFDLEKLYEHLHNVPLYVIITDLWGDVPKLIGISTIPLVDIVTDIRRDVQDKGLSFPSMHGSKDTFPVFNLMGSQVGQVDLGYRLLSLGMSLMPHLPSSSVVQKQNETDSVSRTGHEHYDLTFPRKERPDEQTSIETRNVENNGTDSIVLQDVKDRNAANQNRHLLPLTEDESKQQSNTNALAKTEKTSGRPCNSVDVKTQTRQYRERKPARKERLKEREEDIGDIVVTNTHCPPPLYFNAKWDTHNGHEVVRTQKMSKKPLLSGQNYSSSYSGSLSESSDSYHSRMMEVQYSLKDGTLERMRKVVRDSVSKETVHQTTVTSEGHKKEKIKSGRPLDKLNLHSLPILTALLQELSVLTGSVSDIHPGGSLEDVTSREKENTKPLVVDSTEEKHQQSFRGKPDLAPSHCAGHRSCRHKHCAKPPQKVPSAKGWLRQEPVFKKKETKLQFKMTYSQKLRLKKNNPELLKTLEAQEKLKQPALNLAENKRKMRKKTKTRSLGVRHKFSEHDHLPQPRDVPTEIERHFDGKTEQNGAYYQRRQGSGPSTSTPTSRPPVPTPRRSLSAGEGIQGLAERVFEQREDFSNSERSARSIEVFIPNPSVVDSDGQSGDNSESDNSDKDHFEDTRESIEDSKKYAEVNNPGFPTESASAAEDLHAPDKASSRSSYSQDFESAHDGSERYSDNFDDSPSYHTPREGDKEEDSFKTEEKSESFSPQMSQHSIDSLLESDKSRKSESFREASHHYEDESKQSEEDVSKEKSPVEVEELRDTVRIEGVIPETLPKRLAIPQPPLSSTSPVPLQRNPASKIMMVKPVSVADMEFNESAEVNLPSDLSESFDVSESRPVTSSLEASDDMGRSGRNQWHQRLDVIKSESEMKSGDEYSEDFISELDDSNDA
ncbi:Microtubule-associated protein 10 [Holothuria leucospilota]|uniref:Microtubule-associated protein 10 n=1 Tax=Holothuria leucospilota TaxID=206669 RepID=A0A9Q1CHN2_HOLLE|nr:Microtubule-associated protein 10 [Holothuria leucospilota]